MCSNGNIDCNANLRTFKRLLKDLYLSCSFIFLLCFPAHANEALDALKSRLADSHDTARAKVAAEIALAFRQADADQALYYAQIALTQLRETPHDPTHVNVMNTLAIAHLQKREYEQTIIHAEQALKLASDLALTLEEARAYNTLGALNWYRGDLDKAKKRFEASLDLREQAGAYKEMSPALNNLGVIEETQGHYNKAIQFYLRAIDYAKRIGNDEQLSRPIANLGILHQMLENFDKALLFYQRSLALKLKAGNLVGAALAHNNISEIQIVKGEYQSAIQSLHAGLGMLESIEASQEKAILLVNTGTAHLHLNNTDTAFDFFDRTKNLVSQFNSIEIDMHLAQGYARAHLQKSQLDRALIHAEEFLILSESKKGLNSIKKAHHLHYEIYKQKGLHAPALASYENFFRIHEELTSKKNTDYVARLQAEFDTEKTAKDLVILQGQNAIYEIDIKRQQFIRNFVALLSLSILIVGFLIFRTRTIRIKATLLEQKIVERTEEIQHKNLAISELLKQKDALLERKNFLFSSVSHEFRTPLTLIMGPIKQLANSTSDGNTQLILHRIHQNATRLLRMVDQLLDLARIDMQTDMVKESIEASSLTRFLVTSMSPLFDEHRITCTTRMNQDIWVAISSEALEKIIINLLSNALKYTLPGGEVHVIGESSDSLVTISVGDSGIGIAKDQQPRIFERFTRLENHLDKPVPGAGIGLALVKELVECYGGDIEVESEPDRGSTFTLTFPKASPAATCDRQRLQSTACENEFAVLTQINTPRYEKQSSVEPEVTKEKNGTVLIVEDNEEMRTYIGHYLDRNYQCLYASDGQKGINLAIKEIPDLIVSDVMMPHISGLDLAATLKGNQLTSHIPIILLTAKGDPETRHTAWRKNVDEYIAKPFDAEELLMRCDNILSIRHLLSQRYSLKATASKAENAIDRDKTDFERTCFSQRDQEFLDKLYRYLEDNFYENQVNAKVISHALTITEKQLQRKVKALTNDTIPACVRNFRLKKGADMLTDGANITSVAFDVGFSSQSYFSTAFAARYGCSPSEYQLQKRKVFEAAEVINS